MHITIDQLIHMTHSLHEMYKNTPRWNLLNRFRLTIMVSTVVGMIHWIEDNVERENEDKCRCGKPHPEIGPGNFRSN